MKEYKLQEDDLLASFRPDLAPNPAPDHPRAASLAHNPAHPRPNHHLQRTDGQPEIQRSVSPPVVFNYNPGQQQLQRSNSAYLPPPHFGASPSQGQLVQLPPQYVPQTHPQMVHPMQQQTISMHNLQSKHSQQSQHSQQPPPQGQ